MTHQSNARHNFVEKILLIESAISDELYKDLPPDQSIKSRDHNARARLLRNGLVILQFNTLENYIKERTKEILFSINGSVVSFSSLPEKLQKAALVEITTPLDFMLRHQKDKLDFMQKAAIKMASTTRTGYSLPEFCFFHGKSNIDSVDIENAITAFGIDKPWEHITSIGTKLGFGGVFPKETFTTLSSLRHQAAHTSDADITLPDLETNIRSMQCIGFSFDILLTQALWLINKPDPKFFSADKKFKSSQISYRWIEFKDKKWKHLQDGRSKALKCSPNKEDIIRHALLATSLKNAFIVERNSAQQIVNFVTN